jgi:hypothetical protein
MDVDRLPCLVVFWIAWLSYSLSCLLAGGAVLAPVFIEGPEFVMLHTGSAGPSSCASLGYCRNRVEGSAHRLLNARSFIDGHVAWLSYSMDDKLAVLKNQCRRGEHDYDAKEMEIVRIRLRLESE